MFASIHYYDIKDHPEKGEPISAELRKQGANRCKVCLAPLLVSF
jgi:hypothetical protein